MKPEAADSTPGRGDDLDWARHANATGEILAGLEHRARKRRLRRLVMGAAVAFAVTGGAVWQMRPSWGSGAERQSAASSTLAVIRPRSQVLPDGSVVELRDGAEITVNFTANVRRVALARGAAYFAVAKNPARPFIVSAGGVEVRAVGTAFAVDSRPESIEVIVTEGKVALAARPLTGAQPGPERNEPVSIAAGHRTVVQDGAVAAEIENLDEGAITAGLAWRIPRIEFQKAPLGQIVAELNKHNRVHLVLADDPIVDYRISGALRTDRLDALAEMLAADFGIRAERSADRIVLRRGR